MTETATPPASKPKLRFPTAFTVLFARHRFVEQTGGRAAIGPIADTGALLRGEAGTTVTAQADGIEPADG